MYSPSETLASRPGFFLLLYYLILIFFLFFSFFFPTSFQMTGQTQILCSKQCWVSVFWQSKIDDVSTSSTAFKVVCFERTRITHRELKNITNSDKGTRISPKMKNWREHSYTPNAHMTGGKFFCIYIYIYFLRLWLSPWRILYFTDTVPTSFSPAAWLWATTLVHDLKLLCDAFGFI